MLEKPGIPDERILTCIQDSYGLQPAQLTFLPWGADVNTAVYRLMAEGGAVYFLKLRKGACDELSVSFPWLLEAQGVRSVIAPLLTRTQQPWTSLEPYRVILYPFIEGQNGYEAQLTDEQWVDFGTTLRGVHTAQVPAVLSRQIPREQFSAHWREGVRDFLALAEETEFEDPVAQKTAAFLKTRRAEIGWVAARAEQLAQTLQGRQLEFVLCHGDVHAGNLLLDGHGSLYLVDWDTLIFAPKERDLALVGGCPVWHDPRSEALFYQGYGLASVDRLALTYYRYERIVQDVAEFCKQLLLTPEGGEDREQAYEYMTRSFLPGRNAQIARAQDPGSFSASGKTPA